MSNARRWGGGRGVRSRRIVAVAAKLDVNQATVSKWRRRFLERRLDGLVDEPHPGAPRTITDNDVERVIVRTLEDKPTDATYWSTRDLVNGQVAVPGGGREKFPPLGVFSGVRRLGAASSRAGFFHAVGLALVGDDDSVVE